MTVPAAQLGTIEGGLGVCTHTYIDRYMYMSIYIYIYVYVYVYIYIYL